MSHWSAIVTLREKLFAPQNMRQASPILKHS
jgi:hypothetical protein